MDKKTAYVLIGLAVLLLCFGCTIIGGIWYFNSNGYEVSRTEQSTEVTPTTVVAAGPTQTVVVDPSVTPIVEIIPSATLTVVPTATEEPFTGLVIKDCPTESLGIHPDSGQPLIFEMHPYAGDTNVLCFYEVLDVEHDVKIELSNNVVIIAADFSHGTYNDDGTLKDACPTGWECEGVWVATDDFIIPAGTLMNLRVYIREQPAKQRFTETISWLEPTPGEMAPFACEYVATQGHSMWNIRVPAWAQAQGEVGTIYGFGLPVGAPNRLICEGYPIDWEPLPGQLTTK